MRLAPSGPLVAAAGPSAGAGDGPAGADRVFLFLQGPHGPFLEDLAAVLRAVGAQVWRVAFNAGDAAFWSDRATLIRHGGGPEDWPAHADRLLDRLGVTDIVLYGDLRPVHAAARGAAARRGLRVHVLEEGYLRPFWVTVERDGSNGHSALMGIPIAHMRAAVAAALPEPALPPGRWGDLRAHKVWGAAYHGAVLAGRRRWPRWRTHRAIPVAVEARLNVTRLLLTPMLAAGSLIRGQVIRWRGFSYDLVLLQLEHDANFQGHSDFATNTAVIRTVVRAFAAAAPSGHHLVLKAHPLEDGRARNGRAIRQAARAAGVAGRVHYIRGGKLARLLDRARAVVTVNSTAAQQALWRGLPVLALGRAIYARPGIVSGQDLPAFFRAPDPPDAASCATLRAFLLATSQVPGGFYAARSRRLAVPRVAAMVLAPDGPYAAATGSGETASGEKRADAGHPPAEG